MTSYPCPFCRAQASPDTGCAGCGRGPDPDAAAVVRLDAQIPGLSARLAAAQAALTVAQSALTAALNTVGAADEALRRAWQEREAAAARVRAAVVAATKAAPRSSVAPAMTSPATTAAGERSAGFVTSVAAEASTRVMQNTLFLLGGLLLAVAAIVFTAVAWSQFGLRGRATVLGVVTVVTLAAPVFSLRRRLRATAETFTAVGLLLALLDGYAAWHAGLLRGTDPAGYAGAVFAATAAIGYGYAHLTGLTGPRFAALVLAQPVLPLMFVPASPGAAGWAYILTGLAAANLAVVHLHKRGTEPTALIAYGLALLAALAATPAALLALALARTTGAAALAGTALLAVALVVLAGTIRARVAALREIAAGLLVVALALAAGRVAALAAGPYAAPLLVALVVAVLAVAVALFPKIPYGRRGARIGALLTVAVAALEPVLRALSRDAAGWRLPVVLLVLTAGLFALLPRIDVAVAGAALVTLALPTAFGGARWTAVSGDLLMMLVTLAVAARGPRRARWLVAVACALAGYAFLAAPDPWVVLGVVALTGFAAAYFRFWYAGPALTVALLAAPASAWQLFPGGLAICAGGGLLLAAALLTLRPGWVHEVAVWAAAGVLTLVLVPAGLVAPSVSALITFGLALAAGAGVGVAGRPGWERTAGWLTASVSALLAAYPVGDLLAIEASFVVLGVAAGVLAAGVILKDRAVQAAAHAGAFAALLLTAGSVRHAAAVCTFWGVALGLRALVRGAGGRRGHVIAAAGVQLGAAWLLLAAERVAVLEAYTIPAAAVALLAGWYARRPRPSAQPPAPGRGRADAEPPAPGRGRPVSSWIAYGPALAAALLPTLASVLVTEGEPVRRLALGLAALAVTLAGARAQLRAPVVAGGAVLAVVALHEAALVWDLLPRWIPLAAAGLLLVALAMTLERRRRDLSRVRAAVARMS